MGAITLSKKGKLFKSSTRVIRENWIKLATTLAREQAKVKTLAQVEVDMTAEYYDYYAGLARSYEGEIIQSDHPGEQIFLHKLPIGVAVGWYLPRGTFPFL